MTHIIQNKYCLFSLSSAGAEEATATSLPFLFLLLGSLLTTIVGMPVLKLDAHVSWITMDMIIKDHALVLIVKLEYLHDKIVSLEWPTF